MADVELKDDASALAALEQFVVDNDDLLALEERIGRFNIFDALDIARVEIRHSNFLAWLMNPAGSHNAGALFLKAILMDLLRQTPIKMRPLSPIELDGVEMSGVDVRREWKNLDIVVSCRSLKFVIAVENKIGAGQYNDWNKYEQSVRETYDGWKSLFVLLTEDGDEPDDEDWIAYGYADVFRVLSRCRTLHADTIGDEVLTFLDHYLKLIGSRLMDDQEIDKLCRQIYSNHKAALDLIFDRVGPSTAGIAGQIHELIRDHPERWRILRAGVRKVQFVPSAWDGMLPAIGVKKENADSWIRLEYLVREAECQFRAFVAPTRDVDFRREIVMRLIREKNEFGLATFFKKAGPKDSWTRLTTESLISWNEDEEPDAAAVLEAVHQHVAKLSARFAGIPEALRPIIEEWKKSQA